MAQNKINFHRPDRTKLLTRQRNKGKYCLNISIRSRNITWTKGDRLIKAINEKLSALALGSTVKVQMKLE